MKPTKVLLTLLFFLFSLVEVLAQSGKIQLVQANSLESGKRGSVNYQRLLGNVVMKQKETLLYCDSAHFFREGNYVDIFGNVRVVQDDLTINSATATYQGNQRTANFRGGVVLRDDKMTLTTPSLFYNMATRSARYTEGGTIVETDTRLTSQVGNYNMSNKLLSFRGNVHMVGKDADIRSDSLQYSTASKVVYFVTRTRIQTKDAVQFASRGTYNTETKEAVFQDTEIDTEDYVISARSSSYDQVGKYAYFTGNVRMTSKDPKNKVIITGQVAQYWREQGKSRVTGSPVMRSLVSGDTMLISADTLIAINHKDPKKKDYLFAYYDVRIFKSDLQGRCDSLSYSLSDSVIHLNNNPILWANKSQISADRMEMFMKRRTIDKLNLYSNAFIISQDTLKNLNQIKGRDMVAYFNQGNIQRVDVLGNGESIYFALEGDSVMTGMNKSVSSDLVLKFKDKKIQSITFLTNPDMSFIPPHELKEPDKRLRGFKWQPELIPTKKDVLAKRSPKAKPAKAAPAVKKQPAKKEKPTRAERRAQRRNQKK